MKWHYLELPCKYVVVHIYVYTYIYIYACMFICQFIRDIYMTSTALHKYHVTIWNEFVSFAYASTRTHSHAHIHMHICK